MSRLYSLGMWSFGILALTLALLVPLTVPEAALADSGSDSDPSGSFPVPCAFAEPNEACAWGICIIGYCVNHGAGCECQ